MMRLQKFLSAAGFCSRRKGEVYIRQGMVFVNGRQVTELGTKVDPQADIVEIDGKRIQIRTERIYIMLHKPRGVVTSCRHRHQKIVLDLIDIPERVYPVGRLDKDSTGLLLLTNDGRIHQRLAHPSFDHEKEYEVTVARPVADGALARMAKGMQILGTRTRPARVVRIAANSFRIVLKEGRNRQIRRMVRKLNNEVTALKRIRVAGIELGELAEGNWRWLTQAEEKELMSLVKEMQCHDGNL